MEDIYNAIVDSDSDSDEDDDDHERSCGSEMVVDAKSDEKQPSKLLPPPLQQQRTVAESITTAISQSSKFGTTYVRIKSRIPRAT
jgi:hypothetical protein|mmetsp:Transcript_6761/g.10333  ORF Transcript_6761/g.10333 Transcript_6761/m.10333 type:complete len:85 (-) Transcript_6761:540-794(-)